MFELAASSYLTWYFLTNAKILQIIYYLRTTIRPLCLTFYKNKR